VPISEADRADLYTGLVEVLGPTRAETLMSAIVDLEQVATRRDLAELKAEFRVEIAQLRAEFKADFTRLSFILVAGFLGVIATLIGVGLVD